MTIKIFKTQTNPTVSLYFGDGALFDLRFRDNSDIILAQIHLFTFEFIFLYEKLQDNEQ